MQIPGIASVEHIALVVREERRRQGMDQQKLALVANVAIRSVHRIEQAEPTVRMDTLLKVLTALGLDLSVKRRGEK